MKALPDATKQITHINGKLIIEREPATGPHPRTRVEGSIYKGIENVLLEDGSEVIICSECGWVGQSTVSVSSHRTMAHVRESFQRYPDATLRALIREVNKARRTRVRGSAQVAAAALNQLGLKTASGKEWTADNVSHVYNDYKDRIRVRIPRQQIMIEPSPNGHAAGDDGLSANQEIVALVVLLEHALESARQLATRLVDQPPVDPAVAEKAKKWDEFEKLMGRSGG